MKYSFILFVILLVTGCSNDEFAYNEKVSHDFLHAMESVDELHENVLDGSLKTKYDISQDEYARSMNKYIKITEDNINSNVETLNELKPSEAAKDFHNKMLGYYAFIKDDYFASLKQIADLDCECPEKKDSLMKVSEQIYQKLNSMPDEIQKVQLVYMEKAGLKPNK